MTFLEEVLEYLTKYPEKLIRNNMIGTGLKANKVNKKESFLKSNKYFKRAINTIPLASQTFSKVILCGQKVIALCSLIEQIARVVDPDGNHYIDYILGLLPITLGYCDPDVDNAVIKQIMKGTIFLYQVH